MIHDIIHKEFLDNDYTRQYLELVCSDDDPYDEIHHILPKSIYPEFIKEPWNLVNLSFENHYKSHQLLPFMVDKSDKRYSNLLYAWNFMCGISNGAFVNVEQYAILRKEHINLCKFRMTGASNHQYGKTGNQSVWFGKVGPNKGRIWSESTRRLWSKSRSGQNNGMFGKQHSSESKAKMRECRIGALNPQYGKTTSNAQKLAASRIAKNKVWTDVARKAISDYASISVDIDGKVYKSMQCAAKDLSVSKSTISNWVKRGKAKIIGIPNKANRG